VTAPLGALLFFTVWTVGVLLLVVAPYRIGMVLLRKARPNQFPADTPHGPDWYRRAARAHLNCVENLPVFAALVVIGHEIGLRDGSFASLAQVVAAARVGQTCCHLASGRSLVINVRFAFFAVQIGCYLAMAWLLATA
jgi:uncharacterized MAPEG superfamily protein